MSDISIRINEQVITVKAPCSLSQVLETWFESLPAAIAEKEYVIALNQNFIPRGQYPTTLVKTNDVIELLSPMAGG
jgi:thiamine biosynthesis protein ThiS